MLEQPNPKFINIQMNFETVQYNNGDVTENMVIFNNKEFPHLAKSLIDITDDESFYNDETQKTPAYLYQY